MYAVYHGPEGLTKIADRVHGLAGVLAEGSKKLGHSVSTAKFFDTVCIDVGDSKKVRKCTLHCTFPASATVHKFNCFAYFVGMSLMS